MNYEYNNFSVAQSRFDDGVPANITAMPSNSTAFPTNRSHISRRAVISISIGVTVFVILTALALGFVVRRWRRNAKIQNNKKTGVLEPVCEPEALTAIPAREIGHNSLYRVYRELHDSGKVELLDEKSPSGSGNKINELPQSPPPVFYEPTTHPDSHIDPMAPDLYSTNRQATLFSTETIKESGRCVQPAVLTPYIDGSITTSHRRFTLKVNKTLPPIPVSSIDPVICASLPPCNSSKDRNRMSNATVRTTSLLLLQRDSSLKELNRSLASTLISEIPQVLPLVLNAENCFLARQSFQPLLSRALTIESTYATIFDYDFYRDTTVVDKDTVDAL